MSSQKWYRVKIEGIKQLRLRDVRSVSIDRHVSEEVSWRREELIWSRTAWITRPEMTLVCLK